MSELRVSIIKRTVKLLSLIKNKIETNYYSRLDKKDYPKYLSFLYKKITGDTLNWGNLESYTEKMQWAKLYDNDPLKSELSDKYHVRRWVKNKIGEEYLIPLYGVWEEYNQIDFNKLPNQFVLKTTQASGTNLIISNKESLNHKASSKFMKKSLKKKQAFSAGFQMHYDDIKPLIIAEEFIQDTNGELNDYKFLCFNGKVYYCWVDTDRFGDHRRNVYNLNWELQEWQQHKYKNSEKPIEKPANFEDMIKIAEKLCKGFSHVRVDLYNVNGKIFFGEMTFTNGSGFELIYPRSANIMLGNLWNLNMTDENK